MISDNYIDSIDGCTVHYLSKGNGRPVIFISGWMGTATTFIPVVSKIPDSYQCLILDIPGFGLSTPFKKIPHTLANYCHMLDDFIKKLNLKDPVLVGVSFGATLMIQYTEDINPNISKIVLQSPVYKPFSITGYGKFLLKIFYNMKSAGEFILRSTRFDFMKNVIYIFGDQNMKATSLKDIKEYGLKTLYMSDIPAIFQSMEDILQIDLRPKLNNIRSKVLLIYGNRENMFPEEYQQELAGLIPNCNFVQMKGATHYAMMQMSNEFTKYLVDFINIQP